jgi:hypothetical protein
VNDCKLPFTLKKQTAMTTLHFTITIQAPTTTVWDALWNEANYREWTAAFTEGSHAVSDWKQGSSIEFYDGKGNGIYSEIAVLIPNVEMAFRHTGEIISGVKQLPAEWAGSMEVYRLSQKNEHTELEVSLDTSFDSGHYFNETFPKALQKVKAIAERS